MTEHTEQERNQQERWHVGKEIPLAVLFAFTIQTAGIVWWAATFQAEFKNLVRQVEGIAARQFTQKDGAILTAETKLKYVEQDRRLDFLEGRVKELENRIRDKR